MLRGAERKRVALEVGFAKLVVSAEEENVELRAQTQAAKMKEGLARRLTRP